MLINLRDKEKKLVIKDMLDIDYDMSVEEENNKFYVVVNHLYQLAEEFDDKSKAEDRMISIANVRNSLESELANY